MVGLLGRDGSSAARTVPWRWCVQVAGGLSPRGCLVGDELSRIGWRAQADSPGYCRRPRKRSVELHRSQGQGRPQLQPRARTWVHVDGAELIPRAEQAALGKVVWFAAPPTIRAGRSSGGTASVALARIASAFPSCGVCPAKPTTALSVASRSRAWRRSGYRVARSQDTRLREVEVGWENLVTGPR